MSHNARCLLSFTLTMHKMFVGLFFGLVAGVEWDKTVIFKGECAVYLGLGSQNEMATLIFNKSHIYLLCDYLV